MTTTATSTDPVAARHEQRIAAHARAAAGPRGPASFVWGDFVTEPGTTVAGAPGTWAPLPAGQRGLLVTATAADGIRLRNTDDKSDTNGSMVDGNAVLYADPADGPAVARFPDGAEGIIFTYDDTKYALQVWNPNSDWARRFAGISAFPYDPSWVLTADIVPVVGGRTVAIAHHRDPRPVDVPVVADVSFVVDGRTYTLAATSPGPDHDGLAVLFTDATTGEETYGAGRVLRLNASPGPTRIDFNDVSLLPCSFSLAWNCPIPPVGNNLPFPVRAGERRAIDHEGKALL
ncbi:DUF1684 domain-containing protein [Microbacterium sp.]|uniref:DUF1684 domain-containing protein n=1 Tax=Microbacterium sp. TaxID=51671 RepID=UPI003C727976